MLIMNGTESSKRIQQFLFGTNVQDLIRISKATDVTIKPNIQIYGFSTEKNETKLQQIM